VRITEGIAELGILHATLTVSVNGQACLVEGEAYVQFSYATANLTLRDALAELRQPPNSSVTGANVSTGNFDHNSTATDRAEEVPGLVDQATLDSSPSSPDTTTSTPASPSLHASSGELEGEERGTWYPLNNGRLTYLVKQKHRPLSALQQSPGPFLPSLDPLYPLGLDRSLRFSKRAHPMYPNVDGRESG